MAKINNLKSLMPLTETSFYILISLIEPLHGYGIMQKVEQLSNGRIVFGPGTLYGAINNLNLLGLIMPYGERKRNDRRNVYMITAEGLELVSREIGRLKEMTRHGEMAIAMDSSGKDGCK